MVNCECELARVAPGDMLVTRVAGHVLNHVLSRVGGVVAELGGSTSHLASRARERGIPMCWVSTKPRSVFLMAHELRSTELPALCDGSHDTHTTPSYLYHSADSQ